MSYVVLDCTCLFFSCCQCYGTAIVALFVFIFKADRNIVVFEVELVTSPPSGNPLLVLQITSKPESTSWSSPDKCFISFTV